MLKNMWSGSSRSLLLKFLSILLIASQMWTIPADAQKLPAYRSYPQPQHRGCWGFIDTSGKLTIPQKFNSKAKFVQGFACVEVGNRTPNKTIVDKAGRPITKDFFLNVHDMSENLAVVEMPDSTDKSPAASHTAQTYIAPSGVLLKDKFAICGDFYKGVAVAKRLEFFSNVWLAVRDLETEGHHGWDVLINRKGEVLKGLSGGAVSMNFSDGLLPVTIHKLIGYVDTTGNIVIQPRFLLAGNFSEGLAPVCSREDNTKWGFIDKSGKLKVQCAFRSVGDFHEGLAKVSINNLSRYIDPAGNTIIKETNEYTSLGNFSEGLAAVAVPRCEVGFIDRTGKLVIKIPHSNAIGDVGEFHNGLCRVPLYKNGVNVVGYIDKLGKWAIPPRFCEGADFSEGLAAVRFPDGPVESAAVNAERIELGLP